MALPKGISGIRATGVILAGGQGSRMASRVAQKAFIKVGGVPIILREAQALREIFGEVIVIAGDTTPYEQIGLKAVPDAERFRDVKGPITGVYTALKEIKDGYAFVAACDMPFINPGLVRWLWGLAKGDNLVIPEVDGLIEPLFAFYPKSAEPVFEDALQRGTRRIRDVFGRLEVTYAGGEGIRARDPRLLSFVNVNTPGDLERAEELFKNPPS